VFDTVLTTLGDWPTLILGLVILVFGGDALVKGAVNLALRLGIPALVVGLTVVAFGTSAPELLVSINAALAGQAGIAVGNVVGSNIVNILLILGLPLLITTIRSSELDTRRSYVVMLITTVVYIGLAFTGPLTWWHGLILLSGLLLMLWDNYRISMAYRQQGIDDDDDEDLEGADLSMGWARIIFFVIAGLIGLAVGARLLVDSAVGIATRWGVSETIIGLTLVALGTSLPELVTSIIAAIRRQADVAMGNVIGSNIFNILMIFGVTSLVADIPVDPAVLRFDNFFMLGVSLLLIPFVFMKQDMGRKTGITFVAIYAGYAAWLFYTGPGSAV
jgi:cation:H+ antiporter